MENNQALNSVPPLSAAEKAAVLSLYAMFVANGRIASGLPDGDCEKIANLITALQKVHSDHCPIAES